MTNEQIEELKAIIKTYLSENNLKPKVADFLLYPNRDRIIGIVIESK